MQGRGEGVRSESCAGHLPSLAFLVNFVNILFREPILLRDLEERQEIQRLLPKTKFAAVFHMMAFNFLIIKYIPRL